MDDHRVQEAANRILEHPAVIRLCSALSDGNWPPVYLVGGALRDAWLGFEIQDFDFVLPGEARTVAARLAEALNARFVLLDETWGVARLVWSSSTKGEKATWFDFAAMQGQDIVEDLGRRDFTCNAMAMAMGRPRESQTAAWEDPTGGLEDLQSGLVRMVHADRLREDPLRLLRAFRLACSLGFRVEETTLGAVRSNREALLTVAAERIRDELFKILASPRSHPWILHVDETGLLTTLLPELQGLKGLDQGDFHHLDAWHHTLEAYRILEEGLLRGFEPLAPWERELTGWMDRPEEVRPLLKLAVLFHDAGKPATRSFGEHGRPHFFGHAEVGAKIVSESMQRLRTNRQAEERVRRWVRYHMGPVHFLRAMETDHLTERAKIRFLRRLGNDAPGMLLVSLADFLATRGPAATRKREGPFFRLLDSLLELHFRKDAASITGKHLVTGKDLIQTLGLSPGPSVGRLLRLLEEARVEGKIRNREEALRLARSLVDAGD